MWYIHHQPGMCLPAIVKVLWRDTLFPFRLLSKKICYALHTNIDKSRNEENSNNRHQRQHAHRKRYFPYCTFIFSLLSYANTNKAADCKGKPYYCKYRNCNHNSYGECSKRQRASEAGNRCQRMFTARLASWSSTDVCINGIVVTNGYLPKYIAVVYGCLCMQWQRTHRKLWCAT